MSNPVDNGIERCATLYIVATPIGNLDDITLRGLAVLKSVSLIAAEDTRHSGKLLQHYGISTPCVAYHDFSTDSVLNSLLGKIKAGRDIALISDAGTPLISDPGFRLVAAARQQGITTVAIPGASAVTAALSVAGLATDRFAFEGFLPAKSEARKSTLTGLLSERRTLVFYESPHRIVNSLADMAQVLGSERRIFIGRELTKKFESNWLGTLTEGLAWTQADANQQKGEFVLVVEGNKDNDEQDNDWQKALEIVALLNKEMALRKAVDIATKITGVRKNKLYAESLLRFKKSD